MRRRSFLKGVCGAVAAFLVPAVAARQTTLAVPAHLTDPDAWHLIEKPDGGKTLWVDGSNVFHEGKDGSFEYPYLTLQDAVDRSRSGDTIVIKSGHVEQFGVEIPAGRYSKIIGLGPDRPRFTWQEPS